ncbi:MAG: aminotransferase class V-fold PLP-dependent enzyme [Clostridia bacterium]|nr:aminotransferase class V-fold PLP-dependent enzyme [Clostridia bacterium]
MIYLDNSATSYPKPKEVYRCFMNAIKHYFSNPGRGGYDNALLTAEKIFEIREKTAAFFGEDRCENVVFTANCTTAVNTVIKGVLKPGMHVLVSDLEHNAVMRPLEELRRQNKITYDIFSTDFYDDEETLQSIKNAIQPHTKLLFCTHASNVVGAALPIRKIGRLCRQEGILFAVDAAQSAGILPIHKKRDGIDFLCLAPHKGLFAPMGTGVLIGDGRHLNTLVEGGTGSFSLQRIQPAVMPDRFESGTANVAGIIALGAGLDFIERTGRKTIENADRQHILQLQAAFDSLPQVKTYVNFENLAAFAPVFSFNIGDIPSETVADALSQAGICVRAGLHCAPSAHKKIGTLEQGSVRISPSFFTTNSEINHTISTIKKLI